MGIGISRGWRGSVRLNNLKKCMQLNWNFQRDWGNLIKRPICRGYGYCLKNYRFLALALTGKKIHLVTPKEL